MSTDKIIVPHGSEQKTTLQGLSAKGWKIVGSTVVGILMVFSGNAQCLHTKIANTFNKGQNQIGGYIGLDEVNHTATGNGTLELSTNNFTIYLNGTPDPDGYFEYNNNDLIKIMPTSEGISNISLNSNEPGCQISYPSDREAMPQILPIKRSSISSYVKDGELRVDAKSEQAVNVDYVDMEVSVDGSDFMVEDTEKAINGNVPRTYNFSASVDELIRKYKIVRPTVFYTRLTNHDLDGQTETSDVQAVEISPDGTVKLLMIGSNVANNADQIRFYLSGDSETAYPVRIVNQSSGQAFETFLSGGSEYSVSNVTGISTLHPGIYLLQSMINGIQTQKFVIVN